MTRRQRQVRTQRLARQQHISLRLAARMLRETDLRAVRVARGEMTFTAMRRELGTLVRGERS